MNFFAVILTSLLSVASLFVIAKIVGHKQLSELDFFDYISGITIGSIAAELATELEKPIYPFVALAVYGIVAVVLSLITHKMPKMRKYINGSPTIVMDNGKLYRKNMKKAKLDLSELMILCREMGYFDLTEIQTAVFETNGKLSVLPKSQSRPVTPEDMKLPVKLKKIGTELIMDGRILGENLLRLGVDERWLAEQIKARGYKSASEIFLCICDGDGWLSIFPIE